MNKHLYLARNLSMTARAYPVALLLQKIMPARVLLRGAAAAINQVLQRLDNLALHHRELVHLGLERDETLARIAAGLLRRVPAQRVRRQCLLHLWLLRAHERCLALLNQHLFHALVCAPDKFQ